MNKALKVTCEGKGGQGVNLHGSWKTRNLAGQDLQRNRKTRRLGERRQGWEEGKGLDVLYERRIKFKKEKRS